MNLLNIIIIIIIIIQFIECNNNNNNTESNINDTILIFNNENKVSIINLSKIITSIIYLLIMISTIIGNLLVILSVMLVNKLHSQDNANNYLIVNLAISDLLVGILVMPFALYVELNDAM